MIWYLIFCSAFDDHAPRMRALCTTPVQMTSQRACDFVGRNMVATAGDTADDSRSRYRCVGVRP